MSKLVSIVFKKWTNMRACEALLNAISCYRQFSKKNGFGLHLLIMLFVLSNQTAAIAAGGTSSGSTSNIKSGSQITQQSQNFSTPPQIETYYGYMHSYAKAWQQFDQREPISGNAPGSNNESGSQSNWTEQAPGQMQTFQTRVPAMSNKPYVQPQSVAMVPVPSAADQIMFYDMPQFSYLPITAGQSQLYKAIFTMAYLDLKFDPSRWMHAVSAFFQEAGFAASDAIAQGAQLGYGNAMQAVVQGLNGGNAASSSGAGSGGGTVGLAGAGYLINIANEASGVPTNGSNPSKTIPQAVWMVQQMYKLVFVPLAILFLLPGAVITQVKALITSNFNLRADDASSPFEGILRSIVAVFLIPCTQLIVSYSIDVGNSMAYEVSNWVDLQAILNWAGQLSYAPANYDNMILPPPSAGSGGTIAANGGSGGSGGSGSGGGSSGGPPVVAGGGSGGGGSGGGSGGGTGISGPTSGGGSGGGGGGGVITGQVGPGGGSGGGGSGGSGGSNLSGPVNGGSGGGSGIANGGGSGGSGSGPGGPTLPSHFIDGGSPGGGAGGSGVANGGGSSGGSGLSNPVQQANQGGNGGAGGSGSGGPVNPGGGSSGNGSSGIANGGSSGGSSDGFSHPIGNGSGFSSGGSGGSGNSGAGGPVTGNSGGSNSGPSNPPVNNARRSYGGGGNGSGNNGGAGSGTGSGTNWAGLAASGNWSGLTQAALSYLGGPTSGSQQAGDGEEANEPASQAVNERLSLDSNTLQILFNTTMDIFSLALIVLTAFQLVYMCYLYLLGPLSAAFFAWPTVQGRLFRSVFGNWVNSVIMLSLWRFYWMVILAIMTQRLIYVQETGGQFDLQWEVAVFTCLLGLMFYVPMNPWQFDPAQAYMAATQLGQGMINAAGSGAGTGSGAGGGDGGGTAAGPMASAGDGAGQQDQSVGSTPTEPGGATPYISDDSTGSSGPDIGGDDPVAVGDAPPLEVPLEAEQAAPLVSTGETPYSYAQDMPPAESTDILGSYGEMAETPFALDGAPPFSLTPDSDGSIGFEPNSNVDGEQVSNAMGSPDFAALGGQQITYDADGFSQSSTAPTASFDHGSVPSAPIEGVPIAMSEPPSANDSNDSQGVPEDGRG